MWSRIVAEYMPKLLYRGLIDSHYAPYMVLVLFVALTLFFTSALLSRSINNLAAMSQGPAVRLRVRINLVSPIVL
jgi:hypothetical protein